MCVSQAFRFPKARRELDFYPLISETELDWGLIFVQTDTVNDFQMLTKTETACILVHLKTKTDHFAMLAALCSYMDHVK